MAIELKCGHPGICWTEDGCAWCESLEDRSLEMLEYATAVCNGANAYAWSRALSAAEIAACHELRQAHDAALEQAHQDAQVPWRKMVTDFTKDCETAPIAVMGEMGPEVGRIFLEQAKMEVIGQARGFRDAWKAKAKEKKKWADDLLDIFEWGAGHHLRTLYHNAKKHRVALEQVRAEERERCLDIMYSIEKSDLTLAIGAAICETDDVL